MEKIRTDKKTLSNFGITMSAVLLVIAGVVFLKRKDLPAPVIAVSVLFFIIGMARPEFFRPVYLAWMRLAFVLSWINTRLILAVIFYLIFTSIGLFLKLFRVDLLDIKIDKNKVSYWHKKEKKQFNPLDYEHQF